MHPELNNLSLELKMNGKDKCFWDIDSFLLHIFEWVDVSENAFQGYHSEYLYPNMFGMYITKKFSGGVYQVHFSDNDKVMEAICSLKIYLQKNWYIQY